jgi:DNA adenine methylase
MTSLRAILSSSKVGRATITASHQPLFRWPGGKRQLAPAILKHFPSSYSRYYEPFVGGGAVFFALRPRQATLSDNNPDLINCFIQLRDRPDQVREWLASTGKDEESYYSVRANVPDDDVGKAARLIYLANLSFNGIYRVNLMGQFNVPYGRRPHLEIADEGRIQAISEALQGTQIIACDFEHALLDVSADDVVYLDPPYTVAHSHNGFLKYNARIFSWQDQERLAALARRLVSLGCHVVISNAAHPSITALYADFQIREITRHSIVSAKRNHRGPISELIITGAERTLC